MASTENSDPAEIVHRVRGANGQTADLFVVEKYDGTDVLKVDKDGYITKTYDPDAANYIVWKSGSTYYAKSGSNGSILSSGSDASTVIQAAITALTSGGKIHIKAGTYAIATPLTVSYSGLILEGAGTSTILNNTGSGNVISQTASSIKWHTKIRDLKITDGGSGADAIHLKWCHGTEIRNCEISGHVNGIVLDECFYCDIQPGLITGASGIGLHLDNSCNANRITGGSIQSSAIGMQVEGGAAAVIIRDVDFEICPIGLNVDAALGLLVEGAYFESCSTGCIQFTATSGYTYDSVIRNCFISAGAVGYGINFVHTMKCEIDTCYFYTNDGGHAIFGADALATVFVNPQAKTYTGSATQVRERQWDATNLADYHKNRLRVQECLLTGDGSAAYYGSAGTYTILQSPNGTKYITVTNTSITNTGPTIVTGSGNYIRLPSMTTANKPAAATAGVGALIWCTDATAGQLLQCSDGSTWKYITLTALS